VPETVGAPVSVPVAAPVGDGVAVGVSVGVALAVSVGAPVSLAKTPAPLRPDGVAVGRAVIVGPLGVGVAGALAGGDGVKVGGGGVNDGATHSLGGT
jgi:hypothetical protein